MFEDTAERMRKYVNESNEHFLTRVLFGGGILTLLISSFHLLVFLVGENIPNSPIDGRTHLLATSIFASGLLSFVLIIVYWDIRDTQAEQAQILENQQSLMEASHLPALDVVDINTNPKKDELVLDIRNNGNGPALSPSATIHFAPVNSGSGKKSSVKFPYQKNFFRPVDRSGQTKSTTIHPNTKDKFTVDVLIPKFNYRSMATSVNIGIDNLVDLGVNELHMQFVLQFDHILPTKGRGLLYREIRQVDIKKGMSLDQLMDSSSKVLTPGQLTRPNTPFREPGIYYDEP